MSQPQKHPEEPPSDELRELYELRGGEPVGAGSYGVVRRATCRRSGEERAVKTLSLKRNDEACNVEREICLATALHHPHIATVHEVVRGAEHVHIVMELCTGGELFDRVVDTYGRGEKLGEAMSASYARQILEATCHLHSLHIVHRDIKPENFLLMSASTDAVLKMVDFGAARVFDPGRPMQTACGSPYYIAPQVLKQEYDERCDVWSAGVVLYVLLCGYAPFDGYSNHEVHAAVVRGDWTFTYPDWDDISADAKSMVTSMLTYDEGQRPFAATALTHPWLLKAVAPSPTP